MGHKAKDCWEREENSDDMPAGWVSSKEKNKQKKAKNWGYSYWVCNVSYISEAPTLKKKEHYCVMIMKIEGIIQILTKEGG